MHTLNHLLNEIWTGDCQELINFIPDQSIDLVFTDPPYLKDNLDLYAWLGQEAQRVLRPGGFLCAYAGVYWKWDVMRRLSEHVDYFFDMALINTGNSPVMWHKRVISRYKSILVYTRKGETPAPRTTVLSCWNGSGADKRYHVWGQDESSARYYVDVFSRPGDIVLDPFAGGGTTGYVARQLGRSFISFEIDGATAQRARARLQNQPSLFTPEQLTLA